MNEIKRVPRERNFGELRNYVFDKNASPVLEVELGEKFTVETEDALNGLLREDPDRLHPRDTEPYSLKSPVWNNPVCGPVYVKGVEPGDTLIVTIHKISNILTGVTASLPGTNYFSGLRGWEECDEMYTGHIQNDNESRRGTWKYGSHTYNWDLTPFIGTIATAPEYEVLSSVVESYGSAQGGGGNMDCQDVREGVNVHIQCFNEGGLLYVGDMHASQGDGEVTGVANEAAGEITMSCDVVKGKTLNNLRLETPESLISIYCYRPMEVAIRNALKDLIVWLEEDYGMQKREAYTLASICPEFKINVYQCVAELGRIMTTVGAEIKKDILP